MPPPRKPTGPRPPSGPPGRAGGAAGAGPGTGRPARPRAFDGKRGWKPAAEPAPRGDRGAFGVPPPVGSGSGGSGSGGPGSGGPGSGGPGSGGPGARAPHIRSPEFKSPGFKVPDARRPGLKAPDFKAAGFKAAGFKAAGFKTAGRGPGKPAPAERAPRLGTEPERARPFPATRLPDSAEPPLPGPRARPGPRREAPEERQPPNTLWLHGLHAVAAALLNPRRRLRRLLLTAEAEAALAARLPEGTFAARKMQPERVEDRVRFHSFLPEDAVHQGAALLAEPLPGVALDDALAASPGPVLLLDQVTDPRNVGAILRSAAAFGAACVIVQDRHAPPETGTLARAASGALELVPMVREVNLARAIRHLQDRGAWVLGLAGDGARTLAEAKPTDRRVGLVLGAEGGGLRRLQRETCDELVRLPIGTAMESLNVASAAAVALYEIGRDEIGRA